MNRRQFFQSVVAVAVAPEVKPPLLHAMAIDFRSRYPYEISMHARQAVLRMLAQASFYGKFAYVDTDGVVVITPASHV